MAHRFQFFVDAQLEVGDVAQLSRDDLHHLATIRAVVGDIVDVVDTRQLRFEAELLGDMHNALVLRPAQASARGADRRRLRARLRWLAQQRATLGRPGRRLCADRRRCDHAARAEPARARRRSQAHRAGCAPSPRRLRSRPSDW